MENQRHPFVHSAWSQWSEDQTLHVVSVYFNPFRYQTRRKLCHEFIDHMKQAPNVVLHMVEVVFGDRPYEMTSASDPNCVRLRTNDVLWLKENATNVGLTRLPDDWKYAAYVDCDFHFSRQDWALEAIHQLQHYKWVQLFSGYAVMSPTHKPIEARPSFAYAYHQYFGGKLAAHKTGKRAEYGDQKHGRNTTPGATGGAWAFTKPALAATGGLLETCVLGAGDWYMSFGLIGNDVDGHPEAISCGAAYTESIRKWQTRAYTALHGSIGYVDSFCTHGWHGDRKNRGYGNRWHILRDFEFDPATDLVKDQQGLFHWTGNKPKMYDAVNRYFLSRSEDDTEMHGTTMF